MVPEYPDKYSARVDQELSKKIVKYVDDAKIHSNYSEFTRVALQRYVDELEADEPEPILSGRVNILEVKIDELMEENRYMKEILNKIQSSFSQGNILVLPEEEMNKLKSGLQVLGKL